MVIHHKPGYDPATKEIARKFAASGYAVLMPDLYYRDAPGASPDDAAATARAKGGVPDERLVGAAAAAAGYLRDLPGAHGQVGVIGYCPGAARGNAAEGAAHRRDVQGSVLPAARPVRRRRQVPSPAGTAELSKVLDDLGKPHEFPPYEGVRHAFSVHAMAEHPLNVDVRNPAQGPAARVAVELRAEPARELARAIEAALASAPPGAGGLSRTPG